MMILAALRSIWGALKVIPWQVYAIIAIVFYHFFAIHIAVSDQKKEDAQAFAKQIAAEKAAYDQEVAALRLKQQDVITKTVIQYRDRIKVVKEKGDEIVKQVPIYVPMGSPLLSSGVRVLHDAAASGVVPDDPVRAIAAADPVETSTLLSTVAANYEACRSDQERLVALQNLVRSLEQK